MLALTYRQEVPNGWSEDRERAFGPAMALAERAISLNEGIPEAYFVKGLVHRERKEFFDALLPAEKAIAINPNYADGHIVAGSVMYLAGRAEDGLKSVEKAIRLNPNGTYLAGWSQRPHSLIHQGREPGRDRQSVAQGSDDQSG